MLCTIARPAAGLTVAAINLPTVDLFLLILSPYGSLRIVAAAAQGSRALKGAVLGD